MNIMLLVIFFVPLSCRPPILCSKPVSDQNTKQTNLCVTILGDFNLSSNMNVLFTYYPFKVHLKLHPLANNEPK